MPCFPKKFPWEANQHWNDVTSDSVVAHLQSKHHQMCLRQRRAYDRVKAKHTKERQSGRKPDCMVPNITKKLWCVEYGCCSTEGNQYKQLWRKNVFPWATIRTGWYARLCVSRYLRCVDDTVYNDADVVCAVKIQRLHTRAKKRRFLNSFFLFQIVKICFFNQTRPKCELGILKEKKLTWTSPVE